MASEAVRPIEAIRVEIRGKLRFLPGTVNCTNFRKGVRCCSCSLERHSWLCPFQEFITSIKVFG
jgi:hypothetical protein